MPTVIAPKRDVQLTMPTVVRLPKEEKGKFLARFVDLMMFEDGHRYVVGAGDHRCGLRGQHIATIGLKHDSGYEIVLKLDNGKIDTFRPGNLMLEIFETR